MSHLFENILTVLYSVHYSLHSRSKPSCTNSNFRLSQTVRRMEMSDRCLRDKFTARQVFARNAFTRF